PFSLSTHTGNRLLIDRILYPITSRTDLQLSFTFVSSFVIKGLSLFPRQKRLPILSGSLHQMKGLFILKIFLGKIFNAHFTQAFLRVNNQLQILNLQASDGLLSLLDQQLSNSRR